MPAEITEGNLEGLSVTNSALAPGEAPLQSAWGGNCTTSALDTVNFEDPRVLGSLAPLGLVCLVVIIGNLMVMAAVKMTHKLRGATYHFIVSLACADLMLGVVVLPFSAMYEVFAVWIFGEVWCKIWLAVDVWVCTASILHLVVISLDRYIAVTHPIAYPNIMTTKRARLLIAGAWVLSFVICFPPLVGWNDRSRGATEESTLPGGMSSHQDSGPPLNSSALLDQWKPARSTAGSRDGAQGPLEASVAPDLCKPQCSLNQDPLYVIYSAAGSFYAPMLVMMFFNWKIYRTATKTTKAIRQGWTKVKGINGDSDEVGMGIHRGGGGALLPPSCRSKARASESSIAFQNPSRPSSDRSGKDSDGSRKKPSGGRQEHKWGADVAEKRGSPSGPCILDGLRPTDNVVIQSVSDRPQREPGPGNDQGAEKPLENFQQGARSIASSSRCQGSTQAQGHQGAEVTSVPVSGRAVVRYEARTAYLFAFGSEATATLTGSSLIPIHVQIQYLEDDDDDDDRSGQMLDAGHGKLPKNAPQDDKVGTGGVPRQVRRCHHHHHHHHQLDQRGSQPCRNLGHRHRHRCVHHRGHFHPHQSVRPHSELEGQQDFNDQGTQTLVWDGSHLDEGQPASTHEMVPEELPTVLTGQAVKGPDRSTAEGPKNPVRPNLLLRLESIEAAKDPSSVASGSMKKMGPSDCAIRASLANKRPRSLWTARTTPGWRPFSSRTRSERGRAPSLAKIKIDEGSCAPSPTTEEGGLLLTGVAAMIGNVVQSNARLTASATASGEPPSSVGSRMGFGGKRNIKSQVRRFRMETKAAKTLGIIVGCFICCWFPFFTTYLVTAFCDKCVPQLAFSVIFWLGYCNSALNPFIYAMFSREFRAAFKRILCRLFCIPATTYTNSGPRSEGGFRQGRSRGRGVTAGLHPGGVLVANTSNNSLSQHK